MAYPDLVHSHSSLKYVCLKHSLAQALKVSEFVGKAYHYGLNNGQSSSVPKVWFRSDVWRFSDFTSTESFGAQDNRFPSEMHAVFSKDYADHGSWRVPKHGIAAEEV